MGKENADEDEKGRDGRGGRRRALLNAAAERRLLKPWAELIARGGSGRELVPAVRAALEKRIGKTVSLSVVYRLLARHGWRKTAGEAVAETGDAARGKKTRGASGGPPTLRELAVKAGVSRTTVSLALRNKPSISPGTRERIQRLARSLGYAPDPNIEKLMEKIRAKKRHRRPEVIAYLTAYPRKDDWRAHPTLSDYHDGAAQRANAAGYQLEEFWLREPGMSERRMSEILRARGIDGVIVAPLPDPHGALNEFRWDYFSAVSLGYSLASPKLCRSCNHQFHAMQLLMMELHRRGYRDIGLAMREDHDVRVNHNWQGGYFVGRNLIRNGRDIPLLLTSEWSREGFARWLEEHRPDAVVTTGDEARRWLRQLGLRVPTDIGFAHANLSPRMRRVSGIDQHSRQVGASAVDLLLSLMRANERGVPEIPRLHMVEGSFVDGDTTRGLGERG